MDWSDYPAVVLVVLLVVTNVGLVVGMSTSSTAYGPYNSNWDGGTELRGEVQSDGAQAQITGSTDAYIDADPDTVAFVVAPTDSYGPADIARIRQFVSRGGTLVVAGERANTTNELLAGLGTETRLNGTTVQDDRNNYRNASLPRATNVSEDPLVADVDALTLNRGTVLDVPERDAITEDTGPNVLVRTASTAYLDSNGNGTLDDTEPIDSYPVAAAESVGSGQVIVVSDGSVFTNAMLEQEGNAAFVRAVSQNSTTAVLDYSHRPQLQPLTYSLLLVRSVPAVQAGLALVVLGAVALWARRPSVGVPDSLRSLLDSESDALDGEIDEAAVTAFVRERHPEWDADRIERVSQNIIRQRREE